MSTDDIGANETPQPESFSNVSQHSETPGRVIKFRFWSDLDDKWFYHTISQIANSTWPQGVEADWQQFTGLLDKNGKEVYEGDIVKYNTQVEGAPPKWSNPVVIEWREDRARFDWREDWPKDWSYNGMIYCAYEVIGNIYENKELVK